MPQLHPLSDECLMRNMLALRARPSVREGVQWGDIANCVERECGERVFRTPQSVWLRVAFLQRAHTNESHPLHSFLTPALRVLLARYANESDGEITNPPRVPPENRPTHSPRRLKPVMTMSTKTRPKKTSFHPSESLATAALAPNNATRFDLVVLAMAAIVTIVTSMEKRMSHFTPGEEARTNALANSTSIMPKMDTAPERVAPPDPTPVADASPIRRVSHESDRGANRSDQSLPVISSDEKFASLANLVSAMNPRGMEPRTKSANHDAIVRHFQLRRVSGEAFGSSYAKGMDEDAEIDPFEEPPFGIQGSLRTLFAERRLLQPQKLSKSHHDSLRNVNHRESEVVVVTGSLSRRLTRRLWRRCRQFSRDLMKPMSPTGTLECFRDVVLMGVVVAQLFFAPFTPVYFPTKSTTVLAVAVFFDVVFLLDFLLNFNTAHYDEKNNRLELRRRHIFKRFIRLRRKHWLVVDLVAAVPVQTALLLVATDTLASGNHPLLTLFLSGEITSVLMRFLRWQSLLSNTIFGVRLLRVTAMSLPLRLRLQRCSHLLNAARIVVLFLGAVHYVACFWRATVADDTNVDDDPRALYIADLTLSLQLLFGHIPHDSSSFSVPPSSLFTFISMSIGAFLMALVTSSVAVLLFRASSNSSRYETKLASVFATMDKLQLPPKLRQRIHQYYDHLWVAHDATETSKIAAFSKELSPSLSLEVSLFKYMDLVLSVRFWRNCSADFVTQIMLNLEVCTYLPEDYIMRQGEIGSTLFVVNRGVCELRVCVSAHGKTKPNLVMPPTRRLHVGTAFGELALLMNYRRTATVRALSFAELCTLERSAFQTILTRYRDDRREVLREILFSCIEKKTQRFVPFPYEPLLEQTKGSVDDTKTPSPWEAAEALVDLILAPECVDESIKFGFKDLDAVSQHRLLPVISPKDHNAPSPSSSCALPDTLAKRLDSVEQWQETTTKRLDSLELGMQSILRELTSLSTILNTSHADPLDSSSS